MVCASWSLVRARGRDTPSVQTILLRSVPSSFELSIFDESSEMSVQNNNLRHKIKRQAFLRLCIACSFIHYGNSYSASSRLLLRSAPDPCTAKYNSFGGRIECVRVKPGEQSLRHRVHSTRRMTKHRGCTILPRGSTGKGKEKPPLSGGNCDLWCPIVNCFYNLIVFNHNNIIVTHAPLNSHNCERRSTNA